LLDGGSGLGVAGLCWAIAAGASAVSPAALPPPDTPDTIVVAVGRSEIGVVRAFQAERT